MTTGEPLWKLLGSSPATAERTTAGGDITLVPTYDERQVQDTDFSSGRPLAHGSETRAKTWQASPLVTEKQSFGVVAVPAGVVDRKVMQLGLVAPRAESRLLVTAGTRAMLSQEIRNPRAGRFTFTISACGSGMPDFYRETFLKHFVCRLVVFGFIDLKKDHRQQRIFATADFVPTWCEAGKPKYERFQVQATLRSQDGGAMETSRGIGAAIVVEKLAGDLDLAAHASGAAYLQVDRVDLSFDPRPRDENVTV